MCYCREAGCEHVGLPTRPLSELMAEAELIEKWYKVIDEESFYYNMTGTLIAESPNTRLLEFNFDKWLGGVHRVMFYKNQTRMEYTFVGEESVKEIVISA